MLPFLPKCGALTMTCAFGLVVAASAPEPLFLADAPGLLVSRTQAWGELGWNVAAHAPGVRGEPLRIGDKPYERGLGHHADGRLGVALDGAFSEFAAEVGLQPCGAGGSVIFRVLVDGEVRYDSTPLRAGDAPRSVRVALSGAQELVLEADDAGDGIACDMANWAEARLTPDLRSLAAPDPVMRVDMAPFAQVVTSDPQRLTGSSANRLQEFRAEDLALERELSRRADGRWTAPTDAEGVACIGLKWLSNRSLRELRLQLAPDASVPAPSTVRLQAWSGESAWQGQWQEVEGAVEAAGAELVFRPNLRAARATPLRTRKIRWLVSTPAPCLVVDRLTAFTRSRWEDLEFRVEVEKPWATRNAGILVFNGELLSVRAGRPPATPGESGAWRFLDLSGPVHLTVRHARPSLFKGDETVLRFQFPAGGVGVAVEDVVHRGCVYVPSRGLFVATAASGLTLADYQAQIAGRPSTLAQVRALPEQTLAQAMARTHHEAQREGPVMLSLPCANTKFVVERTGMIRFQTGPSAGDDWFATAAALEPQFADGPLDRFARHLDGGWLPVPMIVQERGGLACSQRSFVLPDPAGSALDKVDRRPLAVLEFTLRNLREEATEARFALRFHRPKGTEQGLAWQQESSTRAVAAFGTMRLEAVSEEGGPLSSHLGEGVMTWNGRLAGQAQTQIAVFLREEAGGALALPDVERLRRTLDSLWSSELASATQIETPDDLLNDVIRSSQVRCLIAARNEAGGERVAPWIAALSYGPLESEAHSVIRGMDFLGHHTFARRSLDFFVHRYNTNGFLTTGYTTFGTAWHLWTLGEHLALTGDRAWLQGIAPELSRVGHWILRQREKTRRLDAQGQPVPESGLMPPAVMADWNAFAFHFMLNGYYHAALREVGTALAEVNGHEAKAFRRGAEDLRRDTLRAFRWTQAQSPALPLRDGTWIPHYPSQVHSPGPLAGFFPGDDAGRSWAYDVELGAHQLVPAGVLPPHDPEVTRMLDHLEDVHFLGEGWFDYPAASNAQDWFNLGGFAKVQPYYARNAEIYALRDDVKPFLRSYFNSLASLLNPEVLTFWEHFRHSGAWDKTHETGYFLHQTRLMLIQERDRELWLAPCVPVEWLRAGRRLSIAQAPTRFGPVGYRIESHLDEGWVQATIDPPQRVRPGAIVLRLRHPEGRPIRSVEVNGRRHRDFDSVGQTIRMKASTQPIRIQARF